MVLSLGGHFLGIPADVIFLWKINQGLPLRVAAFLQEGTASQAERPSLNYSQTVNNSPLRGRDLVALQRETW